MSEPTGKIVGRPMVVRACGHPQEFQEYAVDKFRAQRLAKFQSTRCSACVAKLVEAARRELGRDQETVNAGLTNLTSHGGFLPHGFWKRASARMAQVSAA